MYLVVIAAAVLALAAIVLATNRDLASDLLAVAGILGGFAIVIEAIPGEDPPNGRGDPGK
jgi:hypothetical protein